MWKSTVNAFYILANRVFLTLATRLPLAVQKKARSAKPGLSDLIMQTFDIPPSKRIGELKAAIDEVIKTGEIKRDLAPEAYISFLQNNRSRFGLPEL